MKSMTKRNAQATGTEVPGEQPVRIVPCLADTVAQSLSYIQSELGGSPDLKIRRILIGGELRIEAAAVHLSGLADTVAVNEFVMGSLLANTEELFADIADGRTGRGSAKSASAGYSRTCHTAAPATRPGAGPPAVPGDVARAAASPTAEPAAAAPGAPIAGDTSVTPGIRPAAAIDAAAAEAEALQLPPLPQLLLSRALEIGDAVLIEEWKEMMLAILSGDTAILLEGYRTAIICETRGGEQRAVSEPTSQLVVRGSKDGFVESAATNIALIRRRIKSPKLHLEYMKVGTETQTHVALMYMKGIAGEELVQEVRDRLRKISIDEVLESGFIEELIQDKTFTPFPTIYNTERPDVAAGNLLEGRAVVIVDGTPFVLILPAVFTQFFQSAEDYSQRFDIAILMRLVRYMSFIVLLLGPSVYIALTTYHYEMIPTTLLINLLSQRENVPFPAFVEVLLMETAFEILREAGVRMPRVIGQTVSVVGALILGTAVVEAGIITPIIVIVVALTGIASFAIPAYNMAIAGRIIRFAFVVLGSMFGFYGITLGLIVLVAHMNSLRSFGIPYLSPFVPLSVKGQKDTLLRLPLWVMGSGKSPQQIRAEMPEYMRVTTGYDEQLSPLILKNNSAAGQQAEGEDHETNE
ncbi:spore germination protein [Paenibacillus sp. MMS20-IR301]|uniref:spore germination protein n=1 Tax=Paenibacillus sp. MMS20-IR301 TaxID=2895946 RepID=UPI0028F13738|nr:spore germination protein [Paenibacillus sp. MMS20-IR301]WNS45764.1 spore germination protein [Paenibacillus sp. MMS20-IR301]